MKLSKVAAPCGSQTIRGLAGLGLTVLALLAAVSAQAEDAAKPAPAAAPAKAAPAAVAAKPAATPAAPKPVATKPAPVMPAECVRTGQRVIAALARDDTGAASQFHAFYVNFKCSPTQLAQAFGCLVNLQTANPSVANPAPEHVSQCWNDPATVPKVAPPPPPPQPPQ